MSEKDKYEEYLEYYDDVNDDLQNLARMLLETEN